MIIIVTGARDWPYPQWVRLVMNALYVKHGPFTLYHGDCRDKDGTPCGADHHADQWATTVPDMRDRVRARPADWPRLGNRAGPARNRRMISEAVDLACADGEELRYEAFLRPWSKGTRHTISVCKEHGIPGNEWPEREVRRRLGIRNR